ncbi:hypothetical protein LHEJCM1062_00520 [Lactobacillus helveticus]|uniref:Transposase n=1 Tax=Lactobacillus helveticus TaxID=1587 RepID=A0AAV4E2C3_LACHE|nr:hypothetical protein LHEJCM1007_18830 [Lactobacillus helveticus]GFP12180.1 hypothetical protein LHEJCM1062_00520 [Lactobacillus helveticus]
MQQKYGKCTAGFSKNTYYRFMQNPHINWLRLTILLAERIVNGHLKDLTSDQRADCFVFDDSLYSRTGYKKTELAAKSIRPRFDDLQEGLSNDDHGLD